MKWIHGWKRNGWRPPTRSRSRTSTSGSGSTRRSRQHRVNWHWVKGHAGHAENERADELAREGIAAIRAGAIGALSSSEPPAPKRTPRKQRDR